MTAKQIQYYRNRMAIKLFEATLDSDGKATLEMTNAAFIVALEMAQEAIESISYPPIKIDVV